MNNRDKKGQFTKGNNAGKRFVAGGEQAATARKGALAKHNKEQERKRWREILHEIADERITINMIDNTERTVTLSEAILYGQIQEAIKGNTQAAKFVAIVMGEYTEHTETDITSKGEKVAPTYILKDEAQAETLKKIGAL